MPLHGGRPSVLLFLFALVVVVMAGWEQPQAASPKKDYFLGSGNLVSVIVSLHNNERLISSLLESVEASVESFLDTRKKEGKTLPSFEIVVVEFGSTDATPLKARRYIEVKKNLMEYAILLNSSLTLEERKKHISYYLVNVQAVSHIGHATAKNIGTQITCHRFRHSPHLNQESVSRQEMYYFLPMKHRFGCPTMYRFVTGLCSQIRRLLWLGPVYIIRRKKVSTAEYFTER